MIIENFRLGLCHTCLYAEHDGSHPLVDIFPIGQKVGVITERNRVSIVYDEGSPIGVHNIDPGKNAGYTHRIQFIRHLGHGVRDLDRPNFLLEDFEVKLYNNAVTFEIPEAHLLPWGKKPPLEGKELRQDAVENLLARYESAVNAGGDIRAVKERIPGWARSAMEPGEMFRILTGKHDLQQRGKLEAA